MESNNEENVDNVEPMQLNLMSEDDPVFDESVLENPMEPEAKEAEPQKARAKRKLVIFAAVGPARNTDAPKEIWSPRPALPGAT